MSPTWWLIASALVLWLGASVWRMFEVAATEMADYWAYHDDYDPDELRAIYRSALVHGFFEGAAWPVTGPFILVGDLLFKLAYRRACTLYFQAEGDTPPYTPNEDLLVTDELRRVDDRAIAAGGYPIQHGSDETAELPRFDYPARHR